MDILGLSTLDTLISLLLIETSWWGKEFLENILPVTFNIRTYDGSVDFWIFSIVILYFLKFIGQGILWYAFLRYQAGNSHGWLPKTWFWISVVLDLTLIFEFMVQIRSYRGDIPALITGFLGLLVRSWVWIIGHRVVTDLATQEEPLFPAGFIRYATDRSRLQETLMTLFVWEFVFYALSLAGTLVVSFYQFGASVLLPFNANPGSLLNWILLVLPVLVTFLQLIGVRQSRKGFLKCWFPAYILFNIFGYLWVNLAELHGMFIFLDTTHGWILFVPRLFLLVCGLGLKLGIVAGSFEFLFKTDNASSEKKVTDEEKPLIIYQKEK